MADHAAVAATLMEGTSFGDAALADAMHARLRARLAVAEEEGRPLRVYAGYDPSAPDLHLGHAISLRRLRQFQDLGHDVTVVIGTVTATVGDTSDRASGRPRRSRAEVAEAASTYAEQCCTILDRERTRVLSNNEWLDDLRLPEVLELASAFTVQQFLARDNFRQRIDRSEPVGLHELLYVLLQGYDAVHLRADVQVGGTEQLFNILAGTKLQQAAGQEPCVALTVPILVGTDGVDRMSKSQGNYIGLAEPPAEQFGKVMSVSDATMLAWAGLVTDWPAHVVAELRDAVSAGHRHPMEAKMELASAIVTAYHGQDAAARARQRFEEVHQRRHAPVDAPEVTLGASADIVSLVVAAGAASSRSGARRLVEQGAVRVDGVRAMSVDAVISPPVLLQVGRRRFYRIVASSP